MVVNNKLTLTYLTKIRQKSTFWSILGLWWLTPQRGESPHYTVFNENSEEEKEESWQSEKEKLQTCITHLIRHGGIRIRISEFHDVYRISSKGL